MTTQTNNIFLWVNQRSTGFAPFPNFRSRKLDPAMADLVERYQIGALQDDIAAHRAGQACTVELDALIRLVSGYSDASNYPVFRGLALDELPRLGDIHDEPSLNGWSLYPKTALNLARVQNGKFHVILREKCGHDDSTFYLDEWEDEVLRPPLRKTVTAITQGTVNMYRVPQSLWVVDIG